MKNKKTPASFATISALSALNAVVAISALTGVASSLVSKAQASDNTQAGYNAESQKSLGNNGLEMTTYNTTATQSWPMGQNGYCNDDTHTDTDY